MKTKTEKIVLDGFGSFLGRGQGCLIIKTKEGKQKNYPLSENSISEIRVKSGNTISAGALASCAYMNVDCLILTRAGNPIAIVKSLLDSDSHVETRICQYEALKNGKGLRIAKEFVLAKIRGYNEVLKKYGLRSLDYYPFSQAVKCLDGSLDEVRSRLMSEEGRYSRQYFNQIFTLFSENLRPEVRKTYKAYDGLNNVLNLAYSVLFWKVQLSLYEAKLEPYLGYLHHIAWGLPSLILDFQELYRYLVDDFGISYAKSLKDKDFIFSLEDYAGKKGKRKFLNAVKRKEFLDSLDRFFDTRVELPRIRRGSKQKIETLINEEALLFAKYLRDEKPTWNPRIVNLF
jgi:CRISP-associated protein Cas1